VFLLVINFNQVVDFFIPPISSSESDNNFKVNNPLFSGTDGSQDESSKNSIDDNRNTKEDGSELIEDVVNIEGRKAFVSYTNSSDCTQSAIIYFKGNDVEIGNSVLGQPQRIIERSKISGECIMFIAPSLSGEETNFRSGDYIANITDIMSYLRENFNTRNFFGVAFSAGGYPLTYHQAEFGMFEKLALIAPAVNFETFRPNEFLNFDGNTKIWHGSQDANISVSNSKKFASEALRNNIEIEIEVLEGKSHFDDLLSSSELVEYLSR
jgi:hypothetical protein